ncbi:MAG: hypothetical protein ACE5MK_06120 [Acidobacteriota bacterium]
MPKVALVPVSYPTGIERSPDPPGPLLRARTGRAIIFSHAGARRSLCRQDDETLREVWGTLQRRRSRGAHPLHRRDAPFAREGRGPRCRDPPEACAAAGDRKNILNQYILVEQVGKAAWARCGRPTTGRGILEDCREVLGLKAFPLADRLPDEQCYMEQLLLKARKSNARSP